MFKQVIKEELRVPADIDYLGQLRDFVIRVGRKYDFSERIINAFKLSIDEAATNIMRHAYRERKGDITIRAIIKKNSLTIILIDQGKYFDPRTVKDPDLKRYVDIGKKGGLGIFMMRRLLDGMDYRKTEEGNELRLTKSRDTKPARRSLIPSIPISLRVRYSFYACLIFSLIVAIFYFYYFYRWTSKINQQWHSLGLDRVRFLSSDVTPDLTNVQFFIEQQLVAQTAIKSLMDTDNKNIIYKAFILDSTDIILHAQKGKEILETAIKFIEPAHHKAIAPGIVQFKVDNKEVYDYSKPIYHQDTGKCIGSSHIWIDKDLPDREIRRNRVINLQVAFLIMAVGNASIFFFATLVLNPFRRLTDWIRDLGHAEVQDEMDIDESSEVGEIAQAFNEITHKLRVSQVNLAEQERLQKEMQVAQEIQQTLLPSEFPEVEGYELASYYVAAKQVGGDYYDFVEVDKDTIGIVVADVSGKGVPGSLVMTMIRTALRTEARGVKDAAEVLARVNKMVVNDMKKGMFVTVFYVILDSKRRRISYASAGHNPMILYRAGKNKTYYLNPKGFPLGISLPDPDQFRNTIEADTIQLAEDDIIIIYTDGVTEAMNTKRVLFGEERFLNVIRNHGHLGAESFVNMLKDEVKSFTEDFAQNDDITLVAVKEKYSAEKLQLKRAKQAYHLVVDQAISVKDACDQTDISVYMFNKYKKQFEDEGVDSVEADEQALESKHLSIEEKTRIYHIILKHPEYGAKRISEELKTETYGFEDINSNKIYDELVRSRLNTKELREAFVQRGGKTRRRIKQPGTPMLTLDGRVIIQKGGFEEEPPMAFEPKKPIKEPAPKIISEPPAPVAGEMKQPIVPKKEPVPKPKNKGTIEKPVKPVSIRDFSGQLLTTDIDDLLDKNRQDQQKSTEQPPKLVKEKKLPSGTDDKKTDIRPREKVPDDQIEQDIEKELLAFEASEAKHIQEQEEELTIDFEPAYQEEDQGDTISEAASSGDSYLDELFTHSNFDTDDELYQEDTVTNVDNQEADRSHEERTDTATKSAILEDLAQMIDDTLATEPATHAATGEIAPEPTESETSITQDKVLEDELVAELITDIQKRSSIPGAEDSAVSDIKELSDEDHPSGDRGLPIENEFFDGIQWLEEAADTGDGDDNKPMPTHTDSQAADENDTEQSSEDLLVFDEEIRLLNELNLSSDQNRYDSDMDELELMELIGQNAGMDDPLLNKKHELKSSKEKEADIEYVNDYDYEDLDFDDNSLFDFDLIAGNKKSQSGTDAPKWTLNEKKPMNIHFLNQNNNELNVEIKSILAEGLRYYDEQNFNMAMGTFRQAVRIQPDSIVARTMLANCYFHEKMYKQAEQEYNQITKIDPSDLDARDNLAVIYALQGQYEKAIQIWQSILNCDPDRQSVQKNIEKAHKMI